MKHLQVVQNQMTVDVYSRPLGEVGGDSVGCKWLDSSLFSIYLIDVMGHGEGAARYAARILRHIELLQEAGDKILLHPEKLLSFLNQEYQMQENDNAFFTLWYGVYDRSAKLLTYASAGAPPAVLMPQGIELGTNGAAIGIMSGSIYKSDSVDIEEGSTLSIFSDGVYELLKQDGTTGTFAEFAEELKKGMDLGQLMKRTDGRRLQDDFCFVRVRF